LCIGKKKTEAETKEKICSYCHKKRKEKEEEQEEKSLKVESESRAGHSIDMGKVLWESILTLPALINALLWLSTYLRRKTQN